jgi:hypothetical protein
MDNYFKNCTFLVNPKKLFILNISLNILSKPSIVPRIGTSIQIKKSMNTYILFIINNIKTYFSR